MTLPPGAKLAPGLGRAAAGAEGRVVRVRQGRQRHLGFGRIVASDIEAPNMVANRV
jgi:hypothetical protein